MAQRCPGSAARRRISKELLDTGVYAVHVGIDVSIDMSVVPGLPSAPAEQIAEAYWDLYTKRQGAECIFTL